MTKKQKHNYSTLQSIIKRVNEKKWECFQDNCQEIAINSHLLQVNGILNSLVEKGHLIQIANNDFFDIEEKGFFQFKIVGVNQAISKFLFCNKHDTSIFKHIEVEEIDFFSYTSQLLFSYRSLCGELRNKMKNLEIYNRVGNSKKFIGNTPIIPKEYLAMEIYGHNLGKKDMTKFKEIFEKELVDNSNQAFHFDTYQYPILKICVSAVFSPINPTQDAVIKAMLQIEPLSSIFINVIPHKEYLYIIVGYHKEYANKWAIDYVDSWSNLSTIELQNKLTDLIATRVETWSLSPKLFEEISESSKQKLREYWNENVHNLSTNQSAGFNLFENCE